MIIRSSHIAIEKDCQVTPAVYVASHRRSGTHLTLDSLVANFEKFDGGFENFDSQQSNGDTCLFKTHVDGDSVADFSDKDTKVIYVVRDGRDVMVSLYNYAKSHDSEVCKMSFSEFLQTENPYSKTKLTRGLNRIEYWNYHVQSWLMQEKIPVKVVAFDQWKASTTETAKQLAGFLKTSPKSKAKSMVIKSQQQWITRALAKIGCTKNTAVQFRGGRSQVWKEYFDNAALDQFAAESEKTYQLVSDRLGSEFAFETF